MYEVAIGLQGHRSEVDETYASTSAIDAQFCNMTIHMDGL